MIVLFIYFNQRAELHREEALLAAQMFLSEPFEGFKGIHL